MRYIGKSEAQVINILSRVVHDNAIIHGWYECQHCQDADGKPRGCKVCDYSGQHRNPGELIALCHSELSEALESLRNPEPQRSVKAEGFSELEEELADVLIRVLDMAAYMGLDIGGAVAKKHAYNIGRPHRHGKAF